MQIDNGSNTLIIVLHEIYGINLHMKSFCHSLSGLGYDVICPNLLIRETPFEYSEDKVAYQHFMEKVGFIAASEVIKSIVIRSKDKYENIYMIGFSIGATIAWLCSEEDHLNGIVGYYGSRIRDYLEINPKCPTMLFFPEQEQSFNVAELLPKLNKVGISTQQFKGKHGFSDPYSFTYHEESASDAFSKLTDFIKRTS